MDSENSPPARVFLDTEFVKIGKTPKLLSIGLVSEGGEFIYMEVTANELSAIPGRRLSRFLRQHVVAQFGLIADSAVAANEMPARLFGWLHSLNADVMEVIYDYSTDYELFEQLLLAMAEPPSALLVPTHVGYTLADTDGQTAAESTWKWMEARIGIRRHHALADAMALGARFRTVHGASAGGSQTDWPQGVHDVEAVVTVVIEEFELAHAETAQGVTMSIGTHNSGVSWNQVQVGQRLLCTVEVCGWTRVLHAEPIACEDSSDDR